MTGGELFQRIVKDDRLTENEAAFYIRQVLLAVNYMHSRNVVHLDLKPENLFLTSSSSQELKIIDFGYARRYDPTVKLYAKYGTPEFVSPEAVKQDPVTPAADLWSIGVITYILLSGISPFYALTERETLLRVQEGTWNFDKEAFEGISSKAKDFISKLLVKDPKRRMTATAALECEFIDLANHRGVGDKINIEKLQAYNFRRKWQRGVNTVKTVVRPRLLADYMLEMPDIQLAEGEYQGPEADRKDSLPLSPPPGGAGLQLELPGEPGMKLLGQGLSEGELDLQLPSGEPGLELQLPEMPSDVTPLQLPGTPGPLGLNLVAPSQLPAVGGAGMLEVGAAGMLQVMGPPSVLSGAPSTVGSGSSSEWGREYEDEDTWYEWSSSYQTGPETHLIPSRDTGLSLRLGQYRKATGKKDKGPIVRTGRILKERRDLRDVDKEEDEPSLPTKSPLPSRRTVWALKSIVDSAGREEGFPPIFKEKIRDKAYNVGESCSLRVHVIGNPPPVVSWYRNDELLTDGGRVRTSHSGDGRFTLTILNTKPNDFGVFKSVARNKLGKVTCRARMLLGDNPSRPGRPHVTKVSDTEAFMIWEEPENDGNSYVLAYKVDWHRPGDERWTTATYTIDECALIKGLQPNTSYRFRVSGINKFGTSPYSYASVDVHTKKAGGETIDIDHETKRILLRSRQAQRRPSPESSPVASRRGSLEDLSELDIEKEFEKADWRGFGEREIHLQEVDPETNFDFGSEVWRGRFSIVRNARPKQGKKVKRVVKIFPYNKKKHEESLREYEMLKGLRQEHIVRMHEAYLWNDHVILIFEKLYGENVARSLSLKNKYSEHQVSSIIKQVLDAFQFLHHRGIVHLNLQPDNVMMISRRRMDIKLIDFGRARRVTSYDGEVVEIEGTREFMAPEKVSGESTGVAADIWGVGVLAFILLSGTSPFRGETDEDTTSNIKTVRYDAHDLYHNITKYAMKFIYQTLKRNAKSRLTTEECLEHRWMTPQSQLIKARKAAIFATDKLRRFEELYIRRRMAGTETSEKLLETFGQPAWGSSEEEDNV